jgi:hypothetical protein
MHRTLRICSARPQDQDTLAQVAKTCTDAVAASVAFLVARLSDVLLLLLPQFVRRRAVSSRVSHSACSCRGPPAVHLCKGAGHSGRARHAAAALCLQVENSVKGGLALMGLVLLQSLLSVRPSA